MLSPIATSLSIVFVSLFFGTALLAAWRRFGVQFHAVFWALSFIFSAAGHGVRILGVIWPDYQSVMAMLACQASVGSFALLAIGFRARAHLDHRVVAVLWALFAATIVVVWSAQPLEWRMAARIATSSADALFVAMIVFLPSHAKGLSSPVRIALTFFGLYILSVGIAAWMARPNGEIAEASFVILLSLGTPTGMMATGILTLFILAADLAGELQKQAQYDYLSKLLNRRGFEELLAARRTVSKGAGFIVATDLDRFKSVNDRLGYSVGDEVIRRFACHLQDTAGPDDLVGRMGGEEFALFIASSDGRDVLERVERLRIGVPALYPDIDLETPVTASFGVVRLKTGESLQQAYGGADTALYASKDAGRNNTVADLGEAA